MFTVLPVLRSRYRMNRALQAGVLFILLVRGLLSGAVMFDVHGPSGGFGLVLCSGSGAMFVSDADTDTAALDGTAPMSMAMPTSMAMPMRSMHGTTLSQHSPGDAEHTAAAPSPHARLASAAGMDSGLCAFSAALCAAIIAVAGFGLRLPARVHRFIRAPRALRDIVRRNAYRFARSRAPPFRSMLP